jgi:hypothetical protein
MKHVKILGLAAAAAIAVMAFLGVGSASATVLCKTNSTPCPVEWHYNTGTTISASLESGTITTFTTTGGIHEDECTGSTVEGPTANTGGGSETVKASVAANKLTFSNCTVKTEVMEGGELEIHHITGSMNGTLTAAEFEITINLGVSCVYTAGTSTDLGTVTGGSMATIDISTILSKKTGSFICPSTIIWAAAYTVTSPEPLYIAES